MAKIKLDVVSDVMCPWCYIGRKRLDKALNLLKDIEVEIRWRPFQLDATLPAEGKDRRQYLEDKFGGPEQARDIYNNIEAAGFVEGIDFAFDKIKIAPNTLNAHRLIRWSINGGEDVHQAMVDRLFELFFLEGANLADNDVLVEAGRGVGMDGETLASLLPTDADVKEVQEEIAVAQKMGVTGVPCFIIDNKYAVVGAQNPETLAEAITNAAEETKEDTSV